MKGKIMDKIVTTGTNAKDSGIRYQGINITVYCDYNICQENKPQVENVAKGISYIKEHPYYNRISVFDHDTAEHTMYDCEGNIVMTYAACR